MKFKSLVKLVVLLVPSIFLLAACSNGNGDTSSNTPDVSRSTDTPSTSTAPEPEAKKYNVSFYIDNEAFTTVEVEENNKVEVDKEIPSKQDLAFDGWYTDNTYTEKFDLNTPITSECTLYGRYTEMVYFANYNDKYIPSYSPLEVENTLYDGDENVDIALKISNASFNSSITPKMISLDGALKNLTITELDVNENSVIIKTSGIVSYGEGSVVLAKEATTTGSYIYKDVDVLDERVHVDQSSLSLNLKDHHYFFTVVLNGKEFDNPEGLTPAEYARKHANKEDAENNYFTVNNPAYAFSVTKIHDDFKAFDVQVYSQGTIDATRAKELREDVVFSINGKAFKDQKGYDFNLDIDKTIAIVDINIQPNSMTEYEGKYHIKLVGARYTEAFKNNKDNFVNNENISKSFFAMGNDTTILLKSMDIVNDSEIKGNIQIKSDNVLSNEVEISLDKITLDDNTVIDCIRTIYDNNITSIEKYLMQLNYDYDTQNSGNYQQTASSNYSGIVSVVEDYTFKDTSSGLGELISLATEVSKIGVGLAMNNTTMAKESAGNILGIDALRNPSTVILEAIQGIMDKLNEIEEKIDKIGEKLDTIQEELAQLQKTELLTNFLTAFNTWNSFVTDYYEPLITALNNHSSAYFTYYYNLVVRSIDDENPEKTTVTLYFDSDGKLAYLDDTSSNLSIDGRMIDKTKTITVEIPGLYHALAGVSKNEGHSYSGIEEDIIFDIISSGKYDEETVKNIVSTLRFNAMKNDFSTQERINEFSNTFSRFCQALTGSSISSGVLSAFTPLDCFNLTLETVYNFGFEAEADINLVKIKLGTAYYCAKKIILFVDTISHSQSMAERIRGLDTKVNEELTSERFYHRNDENGNIYSYATGTYVKYSLDSIGFVATWEWENDKHQSGDLEYKKVGRTAVGNFNTNVTEYKDEFKSITEADAKLMAIKVKAYNKVKGTNYTFKEYLAKIGMISSKNMDLTYGIALEMNGKVDGGGCDDLSYYGDKPSEYKQYKFAVKGKALSLDNGNMFTGLCAAYCKVETSHSEIDPQHPTAYVLYIDDIKIDASGKIDRNGAFPFACYANYVTFTPVTSA